MYFFAISVFCLLFTADCITVFLYICAIYGQFVLVSGSYTSGSLGIKN